MIKKPNAIDSFHFKDFSNLDSSPNADFLIDSMDIMMSLPCIRSIKKRALDAMQIKKGDRVLEIGCGHGEDAELLAELVGEKGGVVAVDLSQRMIEEAKRRSRNKNISYLLADVTQLACPDNNFSSCHADRFLVSHKDIPASLERIFRLIKPGGRICFTDVDALSIILAPYTKTTQVILDEIIKSFVNPYIGRQLPEILVNHGLHEVTVIPEVSFTQSFKTLSKIFDFSAIAKKATDYGRLTHAEAQDWFAKMTEAEEKRTFLYSIQLFTVLGYLPL